MGQFRARPSEQSYVDFNYFGVLDRGVLQNTATGLRLVDRSGLAPTPVRATLRAVLCGFSVALFFAGFWLALFDRRGHAGRERHDEMGRAFAVPERQKGRSPVKRPRYQHARGRRADSGVENPSLFEDFSTGDGISAGDVAAGLRSAIGKTHARSR